jgi:hypothetical protein
LWLILEEERSTEVFARVLKLPDQDAAQRRRVVKREKDRIKAKLKRLALGDRDDG